MSPHQKPKEEVCPEMAVLGLRTTLQAHSTQLHIGLEVWITRGTGAQTPKGQVHIRGASTRLFVFRDGPVKCDFAQAALLTPKSIGNGKAGGRGLHETTGHPHPIVEGGWASQGLFLSSFLPSVP